jgi:DNA-binding response OmpR family regulator
MPQVLIAEDDRVIANAMATHLRGAGMDVEWADNGDAALRKLRFERPDVAVIALILPGETAGASPRRCAPRGRRSRSS